MARDATAGRNNRRAAAGTVSEIDRDLLAPTLGPTPGLRLVILIGAVLAVLGLVGLVLQIASGAHEILDYGLFVATFNFLFGLSAAGFAFVAILRLTHADYRRSITRAYETMGVFAVVGMIMWLIMLPLLPAHGQRTFWAFYANNSQQPWITVGLITWFVIIGAVLWNGVIPDAAALRDKTTGQPGWRHNFYKRVALGWTGTTRQWHQHDFLRTGLSAATLLMGAVMQAIIAWDLGFTFAPHAASSVWIIHHAQNAFFANMCFGVILLRIIRSAFGLQRYIREGIFEVFGQFMLALTVIWFYLFYAQMNVMWYGNYPLETYYLHEKTIGSFAPLFWLMMLCVTIVPFFSLIFRPVRRSMHAVTIISAFVVVGNFLWVFLNSVPMMASPEPWERHPFVATLPQILMTLGAIGGMVALYGAFIKLFPIISLWDMRHERALSTSVQLYGVDLPAIGKPEEVGTWSPAVTRVATAGAGAGARPADGGGAHATAD